MSQHEERREQRRIQLENDIKQKRQQAVKSAPIFVIAVIVILLGLLSLAEWGFNASRIHYGVTADSYKLGGKTKPEAKEYLTKQIKAAEAHSTNITHADQKWKVSASDVGLTFDTDAIVNNAYNLGRTGSFFHKTKDRIGLYFKHQTIPLDPRLDSEKADHLYSTIQAVTDSSPLDSQIELVEGSLKIIEGKRGKLLNVAQLSSDIPKALLVGSKSIPAPVQDADMDVSKAEAQQAIDKALALSKATVEVRHEDESLKISEKEIVQLFSFGRSDSIENSMAPAKFKPAHIDGQVYLIPYIDSSKVEKVVLTKIGSTIGKAPINARFSTSGNNVTIIPSQQGTGADSGALAIDIIHILESPEVAKVVTINTHGVEPEITTEKAQKMGIITRISSYTIPFPSGNKPRVDNIKLLASSLGGKLVAPGATFSLNESIGQRTAEKGYKEAGAIVNGELVPQLGGGICLTNTTLFNAVLLSGMPISQRRNHSYYISTYPAGRDATVSWGGPDFKFVNKSDTWVLIGSSVTNDAVTMSIYGTDPGYEIKLSTSEWTNLRDFPIREKPDDKLKVGTKVVETAGIKGGRVVLTRTILKGGTVVSTDTFTSNYTPRAQVVRVGTKEPAPTPPPAAPSDPLEPTP